MENNMKGMVNGKIVDLTEEDKERINQLMAHRTVSVEERVSALENAIADVALNMMEE